MNVAVLDIKMSRTDCMKPLQRQRQNSTFLPVISLTSTLADILTVLGLEDRLRQVIRHLLANAVSCSPFGETIILSAERYGGWTKVIVEDAGASTPVGKADAVFERFYSK